MSSALRRTFTPMLALALCSLATSRGQDASSWIGKKVVTKDTTPLKVGKRVVDEDQVFRVYTVARVNGGWLWLVAENVAGWAPAAKVVPLDNAIDYYTQEIRSNPGDAWAYFRRGVIWAEKKAYDKAIADFSEAIRRDPEAHSAYFNRGLMWQAKQELDRAIGDFSRAIRFDPRDAHGYDARGDAWSDKEEYDAAINDFNEAIRLDARYPGGYNGRGIAWAMKSEYEKAIADFSTVIRLEPQTAKGYYNRGVAWSHKQEYGRAMADLNQALRLDPGDDKALNKTAWLSATCPDGRFRDGVRAVKLATRACQITGWTKAKYLETLAAAYAEVGDFDKAVEWQQKAIDLYTGDGARRRGEDRLDLYREQTPYRDTERSDSDFASGPRRVRIIALRYDGDGLSR